MSGIWPQMGKRAADRIKEHLDDPEFRPCCFECRTLFFAFNGSCAAAAGPIEDGVKLLEAQRYAEATKLFQKEAAKDNPRAM
mgnify:CR=1 FL=1